jgi:hypothetical protein
MSSPNARTIGLYAILLALLAACGSGSSVTPSPKTSSSVVTKRPSSPAIIEIISPAEGSVVKGPTVDVTVAIQNARIVQATSTNIKPDEGHVHLFIDGNLQYMGYSLSQPFTLSHPGTYTMYAEFVASDHAPFDPRVKSKNIVFTVT